MALPQVFGEFRLGGDPDLRFAPSGVAVATISAVASSRKKEGDEWVDDKTTWVQLVGFKKLAENMAESFFKGDLVVVAGKLQVEDWEDNDGNKRKSVKVILDHIGPSVAWDAARSLKSERSSNSGGGSGTSGASRQEGQAQRSTTPAQNDPWSSPPGDEPPF